MGKARDSLISAEDNQRMFDRIAHRYSLMNRILSLGLDSRWRRVAIVELEPLDGKRYIDIGCGPGDMAFEILKHASDARVVGIDPSVEMLQLGEMRAKNAGLADAISFEEHDALHLPFDDASFSGATSAFCIRNVEDRYRAFLEMHRVLIPGSRIVVLELTNPQTFPLNVLHRIYNATWVPFVGRILSSKDAYEYLNSSIKHFPKAGEILDIMAKVNFANPRHISLNGGIVTVFVGEKKTSKISV